MLALIISYRYFNLPQYLLIDFADCRSEGGDSLGGIEIKNAQKIFVLKAVVRLQSAA